MSNEIKIQKTTAFLLAGLLLAVAVGGFIVFGASAGSGTPQALTQEPPTGADTAPGTVPGVQDVYLKATAQGYDKSEITVRRGIPVRLHFTAINAGCGAQLVIYGTDVRVISRNGQEAVVEFTPDKEGTYEYNCGMRMFPPGRFVVTA
ncbi:MAG: cupredoxin domain-containing protein [Candidatus Micrarchaeota archaeon]